MGGEPDHEVEQVRQAASGNEAALTELLRSSAGDLRAHLTGRISNQWRSVLEVDDVLQVTFLEAFLQIGRFHPAGPGAFLGWLKRIADNNLKDAIRSLEADKRPNPRRRVQATNAEDSFVALVEVLGVTTTTPSRQAAKGEALGVMQQALSQLPPDYEKVLRMYDLEGRPVGEVAAELKRSPGAVFMLRARAHDRLREVLGSESKFFSVGS